MCRSSLQVHNAGGKHTNVRYRLISADFLAETWVTAFKNQRRLFAVGRTRAEAMQRLAAHCLEYHHPSGDFRTKSEAAVHFMRHEGEGR